MTPSSPLVSVLIVNFNGLRHLRECLDSVLAQTYPNLEVVLVDNASQDDSVAFIREHFPQVMLVISEKNLGFAGGNNLGGKHCRGEMVFFLNNDTRAEPDAVAALIRARAENPEYTVFGSLLLQYDHPDRVDSAGDTFYWAGPTFSFSGFPVSRFTEVRPITSAKGAAAMYPKELLDRIGWFDEDFFLNFEDLDLALRARHVGARTLSVPQSRIRHKVAATLGGRKSATSFYYGDRNFQLTVLKNFPLPVLLRFLPGMLFFKAGRAVSALQSGCLGAYLRGNFASLRRIPAALAERRKILGNSPLTSGEFAALLRKDWLRERMAMRRGNYDVPV